MSSSLSLNAIVHLIAQINWAEIISLLPTSFKLMFYGIPISWISNGIASYWPCQENLFYTLRETLNIQFSLSIHAMHLIKIFTLHSLSWWLTANCEFAIWLRLTLKQNLKYAPAAAHLFTRHSLCFNVCIIKQSMIEHFSIKIKISLTSTIITVILEHLNQLLPLS